jgi:hypothetical protein
LSYKFSCKCQIASNLSSISFVIFVISKNIKA